MADGADRWQLLPPTCQDNLAGKTGFTTIYNNHVPIGSRSKKMAFPF